MNHVDLTSLKAQQAEIVLEVQSKVCDLLNCYAPPIGAAAITILLVKSLMENGKENFLRYLDGCWDIYACGVKPEKSE